MAIKDLTRILTCVVFFASLLDMAHAHSSDSFSFFVLIFVGVLCSIAIITGFILGVCLCCKKHSVNPNQGVNVTVIGADTRTIVTSDNTVQEQHPMEQYPHV
uniref:Uncharacterized protein LOC111135273 n=1 Tax=Crassostrea virginica TaxID=6565 RepID=A0A8B8ELW5_CRAVI|nr:uncharacterized protein LOC111135273 [Crassostrea virginica]